MQPILVNFKGTRVLIVGFGPIGQHKASVLFDEGASIYVVDPMITEEGMRCHPEYDFLVKAYETQNLKGVDFVVIATGDKALNQRIAMEAKERHLLCSVVSSGEISSFTFMSVVKRGDLTIGISTKHRFPGLTKQVRVMLEDYLPEDYGDYIDFMAKARQKLLEEEADNKEEQMKKLMCITYEAYKQGRN